MSAPSFTLEVTQAIRQSTESIAKVMREVADDPRMSVSYMTDRDLRILNGTIDMLVKADDTTYDGIDIYTLNAVIAGLSEMQMGLVEAIERFIDTSSLEPHMEVLLATIALTVRLKVGTFLLALTSLYAERGR